jgi:hypothetical protein
MLKPADVFSRPDMHASCLLLMAVDSWGTECIEWEPETFSSAVRDTFDTELDGLNYDKLNAAISLVASNLYHRSPGAFCAINKALSFKTVNSGEFNVCSLDDVLWGTTEAQLIMGQEEFVEQGFTQDISRYVGQLLEAEGVTHPPSNLSFAKMDEAYLEANQGAEFTDPAAWKMTMQREEEDIEEMNKFMGINLTRLFAQLKALPLTNRDGLESQIDEMLNNIKAKMGEYSDVEDYTP